MTMAELINEHGSIVDDRACDICGRHTLHRIATGRGLPWFACFYCDTTEESRQQAWLEAS